MATKVDRFDTLVTTAKAPNVLAPPSRASASRRDPVPVGAVVRLRG